MGLKIKLASVLVEDQERALEFYTTVLGFEKKTDFAAGDARWLTVVSPDAPDEVELLLEPNSNPASRTYQSALLAQGIPATAFAVDDIQSECERLKGLGVMFQLEPQDTGDVQLAVLHDTCGNLIQLYQL